MFKDCRIVDLARQIYYDLWDFRNESGFDSYTRYKFFKYLGEICEDYEVPEEDRVDRSAAVDFG